MLETDSQDDVLDLCRSVRMDPSAYKRFDFPVTVSLSASTAYAAPAAPVEAAVSEPDLQIPKSYAEPPAPAPATPATPERVEERLVRATSYPLLEVRHRTPSQEYSVGSDLSALANVHSSPRRQPSVLPLVSGVGGCGATTILAALGRALSILGERVLLVDAGGPSTIDCFYDSESEHTGLLLSTSSLSQFEGQVHVVRTHAETSGSSQNSSTRLHRATAELRGRLDRILVAGADSLSPTLARHAWSSGMCLVIVTPEMRSVLAVHSILKTIAERSKETGVAITPWFLLNRYNDSIPSHAAARDRLVTQLGSQLLPFGIPESEVVEESLSHGLTVLDVAPQSAFAEACFDLAEWYRAASAKSNSITSQLEETQLVPE